jgi:hypothetical protein
MVSAVRVKSQASAFACGVQPRPQVTVVAGSVGAAVRVTVVPLAKAALQVEIQLLMPAGELLTVPVPVTSTRKNGPPPPPPLPVKQTTFAVIVPVTIAPEDGRSPALWFVCTVAETRAPPQSNPVTTNRPEASTVAIPGVLETHVT